ncbi:uncharacterized protein LOC124837005 [Vigna umbellata]|uniref:uncharacterized protein LOC124837005 n=1 Tax=Vigna umbellata TaxID=87088 RepID=UPI001F5F725D|nr:uncharacterized protein LOC124837005 [Vigna umbellata]
MRLNPAKYTFRVAAGKFLGFMLTSRGIEANPDKCEAVLQMQSSTTLKEIQRLLGRLTALSWFIPRLAERVVRLRPYFQSHQVVVRTDYPISKILRKSDLAGRMVTQAVELSEFGLRYEPRGSIKGQHLADFAAELPQEVNEEWNLYVDGASGRTISGTGIVLEGPNGFLLEHSLIFKFKVSNNQAEYEALVGDLELTRDMGARRVVCRTDSQLVVGQMNGEFQVKEEQLLRYFHKATALAKLFDRIDIRHIPRENNTRADMLSKLSSSKEKGQITTIIRQVLLQSSVECMSVANVEEGDWRSEIRRLMTKQDAGQPVKSADAKKIACYLLVGDDLYRRGFSTPLLKCLGKEEACYVMDELHNGICGFHTGRRTLKARILRVGYYWPTMEEDAKILVQRCLCRQAHTNNTHLPLHTLHTITSP